MNGLSFTVCPSSSFSVELRIVVFISIVEDLDFFFYVLLSFVEVLELLGVYASRLLLFSVSGEGDGTD